LHAHLAAGAGPSPRHASVLNAAREGRPLLEAVRLCEPCAHLEALAGKGVRPALVHRGGLRTVILKEGTIRVGDPIEPAPAR
jgi:MOSC domain-containing protein YiiM